MHKHLIVEAFKRAGEKLELSGVKNPKKNKTSKVLSDFIDEEMNFNIGDRSLKNYFSDALEKMEGDDDINIAQLKVVTGLCRYLGYNSYEEFMTKNRRNIIDSSNSYNEKPTNIEKQKSNSPHGWFSNISSIYKLLLITIALAVITVFYFYKNQPRWMVWHDDHYIEAKFNTKDLADGKLKVFKKDRIMNFKKIEPDCNTIFFNNDGSENLWYGKNQKGELEYFTSFGLHPETGKTLKHITVYMIQKYICEDYK